MVGPPVIPPPVVVPDEPDEPVVDPDVPLGPGPEEPDEPGSTGGLDEEEIEDEEVPLADVPKTSDDLSLLWVLLLAASATLTAMRFTRRKRAR